MWRSSLCRISSASTQSVKETTPTTDAKIESVSIVSDDDVASETCIAVPHSGKYGLCFGSSERNHPLESSQCDASSSVIHKDSINGKAPPHCGCVFEAEFRLVDETDESQVEVKMLRLPLSSSLQCDPYASCKVITSNRIGRLLYIPSKTSVSVTRTRPCSRDCVQTHNWQWGLTFQTASPPDDTPVCQPLQTKKAFLCNECTRTFPSPKGVAQHLVSQHSSSTAAPQTVSILTQPLKIAYEDSVCGVVIKPQGIAVMGVASDHGSSIMRSDLLMALKSNEVNSLSKPRAVHRLDSPTGGLLLIAKTKPAEVHLKSSFLHKTISKRYCAIVFGRLEPDIAGKTGLIESKMNGDKLATTRYEVIGHTRCSHPRANGWITTVHLFPVTGRRHQLRKHMKLVGHPIWGDKRYGPYFTGSDKLSIEECDVGPVCSTDFDLLQTATVQMHPHVKLCLWAVEITFPHPTVKDGKDVAVKIDEPLWYEQLRRDQDSKWRKRTIMAISPDIKCVKA